MSPEPLSLKRVPAGVRVLAGSTEEAHAAILQAALDDAFEAGASHGREAAREETSDLIEAARGRLEELQRETTENAGRAAVQLAIHIARYLLRREVAAENYDLEGIVREALAASGVGRGSCVVHLNPVDAARLAEVPFRSGTSVEPDPEVPPGDVHVTTPHGLLVRELDAIVKEIGERILGDLR